MTLKERIDAAVHLGQHLMGDDEFLDALMHRTEFNNQWFTKENQRLSLNAIRDYFLDRAALEHWVGCYNISDTVNAQKVGLVLAGNIPLVGFHDVLSVFMAGHKAQIKLSDKDKFILPYLVKIMAQTNEKVNDYFAFTEKLTDFQAVIATGSNNSARYFQSYFGKYPHIIRRNRNSVAVLNGAETEAELLALGNDIFQYFGLGCRNVSKLYIPQNYNLEHLLEVLHEYKSLVLHTKYKNNFDYNYALYILNKVPIKNNGCIILTEDKAIQSRIANLHYEYYDDANALAVELEAKKEEIQAVVAQSTLEGLSTIPFGKAQQPSLMDYADGVDTMAFLVGIG